MDGDGPRTFWTRELNGEELVLVSACAGDLVIITSGSQRHRSGRWLRQIESQSLTKLVPRVWVGFWVGLTNQKCEDMSSSETLQLCGWLSVYKTKQNQVC